MKKVRMTLLLLLLLMSTINYYQVSNLFDLDNPEPREEVQFSNRKIPILASNSTVIARRTRNHNQATKPHWLGEQNLENQNNNKTMYSGVRVPSYKITTRGPIDIDNDTAFGPSGYNFNGSGTESDPYIIEEYNITDSTTNLIDIQDTTVYFVIRNCLLNGVTGSNNGLTLSNVMNGFVEHNIIINCDYGLYVQTSSNNEILDNSFSNNEIVAMYMISDSDNNILSGNIINSNIGHGFYLYSNSNNNTIFNNTFSANGDESIHAGIVIRSYNNSVINNYIINNNHHGIYLSHADNNSIRNNSIYGNGENGFLILESENNTIHENIIHDNSNGFALEGTYLNRIYNNTIYSNSNGITIFRSNNDMIYNNNISSNGYGIQLQYSYTKIISHNITIESNSFISNSIAIRMVNVSDCDVLDNEFILSLVYGIYLTANSSDNTLSRNVIRNSSDYGIYLDSTTHNNIISLNEFYFNKLGNTQACDISSDNTFSYNYWDDHTGPDTTPLDGYIDNPYNIDGGSNMDPYPLVYPLLPHSPIYIDKDADFATLGFSGQGTINDPYMIEEYYFINSTTTLIHIQDTTSYFTIRYNRLNGINSSNRGIYLENVVNGYIHNNSIQNGTYGIKLVMSDNNNLTYNIVFNCGSPLDSGGIVIQEGSDYNILKGNEVYNCTTPETYSISLHTSDYNLLENNQIYKGRNGIKLYLSNLNNVSYNIIDEILGTGNSIGLWGRESNNNTFSYNIITDNNYEPFYLQDSDYNILEGNIIANNSRSGIDLHSNSIFNQIRNNTIYNQVQQAAVRLRDYSTNNLIIDNMFYQNKWGILCGWGGGQGGCNNNDIINNTIIDNTDYGIQMEKASYNLIINNTITNNALTGIYFVNSSGYNTILSNNIFSNIGGQSIDDNGTNEFHYQFWGNYWGNAYTGSDLNADGIGDSPYSFPGNLDLYPLVHPIEWYSSFNISVITGDWDVTTTEIHQNKILVVNGNVTIQSGGNLTLKNVILRFNCSFNGQYHMEVFNGGILTIKANSVVTAFNISNVWYLKANGGSNIYFKNSTFSYAGLPGPFVSSGIWINTDYSEIVSCIFHNCLLGLILDSADFSEIRDNLLRDINQDGIRLYNSHNNSISGNNITNTISYAIFLDQSDYNELFDNTINECFGPGINLNGGCNYNNFSQNLISKSKGAQGHGIYITFNSDLNLIFNNSILGNSRYGILLDWAYNNTILENTIADNSDEGIYMNNCENNSVMWNKFSNNNLGGIQARDTGSNNTFTYNYWDDHTGPDANFDGIVDVPYIFTGNNDPYPLTKQYTGHEPIFINNNANFTALGFPGNGSLSNPYLIEGYYFINTIAILINIQDTTAYFIIRNNTLNGITGFVYSIKFTNVTHGTITNNTIINAGQGIFLESSSNNTIYDNTLRNNTNNNIYLLDTSCNNTITGNILSESIYGIHFQGFCDYNTIAGNTIFNNSENGIYIHISSNNNTFTENSVYNNTYGGLWLLGSSNNTISDHSIVGNGIYGLFIDDLSNNNIISNNSISNHILNGILIINSHQNEIVSNTIYNNTDNGIRVQSSALNNTIQQNTIYDNNRGIRLYSSNNTLIIGNSIFNHTNQGLYLESAANYTTVEWNSFIDNGGAQILSLGSNNQFRFNYWGDIHSGPDNNFDGIIDIPYFFTGGNDPDPLIYPYRLHTPIYIDEDTDFGLLGFPGQGSLINPYIIQGYFIIDSTWHLIEIRSTGAYFIIRNCLLNALNSSYDGISIINATHGIIEDNLIHNCTTGISLTNSVKDITVLNNTIHDNLMVGILLQDFWSGESRVENNTISNNTIFSHDIGILLGVNSSKNIIIHNNLYNNSDVGIYVTLSSNNVLNDNSLHNNNIFLSNASNNFLSGNIISNSGVAGIQISFSSHNNTIAYNTIYNMYDGIVLDTAAWNNTIITNTIYNNTNCGIHLSDSSDITVSNNLVYNNSNHGIYLGSCTYCTISDNRVYNNSVDGINLWNATLDNLISNNEILDNNRQGVRLQSTAFVTVSNNTISGNSLYGMGMFYSNYSTIIGNRFFNNDPYGIWVIDSSTHNTIISNNVSFNVQHGIYFKGGTVVYNIIENNTIYNNSLCGILLEHINHTRIVNNTVYNHTSNGIQIWSTSAILNINNSIFNNTVYNSLRGIYLTDCNDSLISNNTVFNNYLGIYVTSSLNNSLISNNILINNIFGIQLSYSFNNTILNNVISNNAERDILLSDSNNQTIMGNLISDSNYGIELESSDYTVIRNNSIRDNTYYGISILLTSDYSLVFWNDFIDNYEPESSQAYDEGSYNNFTYNYWNDWTTPDDDSDGIVDVEYSIDGDSNTDPFPLTFATIISPHELSILVVIYPNGNETLHGTITITWTEVTDGQDHVVTYTLYYSVDNRTTWIIIESDYAATSYNWNTLNYVNTTSYLIGVNATCSEGLWTFDISNDLFTIQNPPIDPPIMITDDADFETFGFSGSGTENDPYIIEGYYFANSSRHLIEIRRTFSHFIIRNNYLDGMNGDVNGIYLYSVINGKIENNNVFNCSNGIYIYNSENTVVFNNRIQFNTENGIYLLDSDYITITTNIIRYNGANGVFLENSDDNTISYNIIYDNGYTGAGTGVGATIDTTTSIQASNRGNGIFLDPADDNTIFNNSIYDNSENGIYLFESDHATISNNTINDNGANGVFLNNSNENTIANNTIFSNGDAGAGMGIGASLDTFSSIHASNRGNGIFLDPANDNIISNNRIFDNIENGIYILSSLTTFIFENQIFENGFNGIFLEDSDWNTIFSNIINFNGFTVSNLGVGAAADTLSGQKTSNRGNGVFLDPSNNNNVSYNVITNNSNYGILIGEGSEDNLVQWNDFFGNNPEGDSQGLDDGSRTLFSYNYWDDHDNLDDNGDGVADKGYSIDGTANNFDLSPMASPEGELIDVPPSVEDITSLFLLILIILILGGGVTLTVVNRKRIKSKIESYRRKLQTRTEKRKRRDYDHLAKKAEDLAKIWEKDEDT